MKTVSVSMKMKTLQQGRLIVPFFIVVFLSCGVGGFFCPMIANAASHPSHEASHSSPGIPSHSSGDCQDQIKTSSEEPTRDLTYSVLPYTDLGEFTDIFKSGFSEYLFASAVHSSSSYPLLFVLFSVFLN